MADEVGGKGMEDINAWWEVRENMNKVTEEAVRRVQDDQKKAQQVGQEIKKDKATNHKLAKFLTFLLKDIKSDTLVKQIYHAFFKTNHEEEDLAHLKKSMNIVVVVGVFVPFYQAEIKEFELESMYKDPWTFDRDVLLTQYIDYIKKLLHKYHDNTAIDTQEFTKLLAYIAEYYHLTEKLSPEKAIEFENTLKKELSLNE